MPRKTTAEQQPQMNQQTVTIDSLTLQSMGAHMIFDVIHELSARFCCEFIIKANMMFEKAAPLILFINSPGGNVNDGWAIVDTMYTSTIPINTIIMGQACSMASIISVAGTKGFRYMTKNSYIMTHQFWTVMHGKSHELMAARKLHDSLDEQFIEHFVRHTKMKPKQVKDILLRESDTWLEPKDCLKYGLIDKIVAEPWTEIKKVRDKAEMS